MAPPAIATAGAGRRFIGRWAVRGVTLAVPQGAFLLVYGPNGAGKTTLLRLMGSALAPNEGTVSLFGGEAAPARSRVALLTHADGHYDELSGRENLEQAKALGGLRGSVDEVPVRVGLHLRARDPVRQYSAGMRKRLAFARLLLKEPELALFDEPYAALDEEGHTVVDALFQELHARGTTVVVSTHQVARVSALCTHHAELCAGQLVAFGPGAPARSRQGVRAAGSLGEPSAEGP